MYPTHRYSYTFGASVRKGLRQILASSFDPLNWNFQVREEWLIPLFFGHLTDDFPIFQSIVQYMYLKIKMIFRVHFSLVFNTRSVKFPCLVSNLPATLSPGRLLGSTGHGSLIAFSRFILVLVWTSSKVNWTIMSSTVVGIPPYFLTQQRSSTIPQLGSRNTNNTFSGWLSGSHHVQ